jgi:hypothetical protein
VREFVADLRTVVARMRCTGTHQGEWQGLAATGRRMRVDEVYFLNLINGVPQYPGRDMITIREGVVRIVLYGAGPCQRSERIGGWSMVLRRHGSTRRR